MSVDHARAWGEFWQHQAGGGGGAGCLPAAWEGFDRAQRAVWSRFAARLPRGARVIDLATGDGRVMGCMLKARRDLKLVGTDLAPKLPPPPRGAKVRAGVAMESLPFANARFDAATSQFGFEYTDVARSAREIARVLKPGGLAGLLSHHGDGPILAHNLQRRKAILWAVAERDLVTLAKRSLSLRASGISAVPRQIAAAPAEGAQLFGKGSAAWEIAEAVRQTLTFGARDSSEAVGELLNSIAAKAENELMRIASLEAACAQSDNDTAMSQSFANAGLAVKESAEILEEGSERPFAQFRLLTRA